MSTYFKATRLDGTDFYTGKVDYLTSPTPPLSGEGKFPGDGWYHLATVATDCAGMVWPCRLFSVKPAEGSVVRVDAKNPYKVGCISVEVLCELDAYRVFGPQGRLVVAFIERLKTLSANELESAWTRASASAWASESASASAWARARARACRTVAALLAYRGARAWACESASVRASASARASACASVRDSALASALACAAIVFRDLISVEEYTTLTSPFTDIIRELEQQLEGSTR